MVLRELRMKHDIHQPLQPTRSSGLNLRHASNRPWIEAAVSYDAKAAYLEKLQARIGQKPEAPVTPETSSEEPAAPEVEVPAETLSGIVNGPSGSASGGTSFVSRAEWNQMMNTDPKEAERLFLAGKVDLSDLRQGLGPDR